MQITANACVMIEKINSSCPEIWPQVRLCSINSRDITGSIQFLMVYFFFTVDVNPEFNFQLFRFTISMEQLNFTKVRLAVYDQDPGDEDDFLGVVFIDLSKAGDFINNVITNWYPLQPQVSHAKRKTMLWFKDLKRRSQQTFTISLKRWHIISYKQSLSCCRK